MKDITGVRNHWSYILEQVARFIWLIIGMIFAMQGAVTEGIKLLREGHFKEGLMVLGGFFVIVIIVAFICFRRWLKTTMTVRDGVITIKRDTMFKKVTNINITNISNINLERNLFELFMGTYKLKIDTSSTTEAMSTDMLMVFKKDKAEEIRAIVMEMVRKARETLEEEAKAAEMESLDATEGDVANTVIASPEVAGDMGAAVDSAPNSIISEQTFKDAFAEDNFDVTYNAKEFLINAITSTSIIVFLLILGGIAAVIAAIVIAASSGIAGISAALGGLAVVVFTILSIIWAQIKSWESDVNFRSTRREDSILINTGLVTRRKYTIPLAKVNAIEINSTFLGVITKRARVDVVNIGGDSGDTTGHRILLYDKIPELMRKLKLLIPEFKTVDKISYERQPVNVLVRSLIGCTFWFGLICGGSLFAMSIMWKGMQEVIIIPALVMLVIYMLTMLGYIMSYKRRGLYYDDLYLVVVNGVFSRSIKVIPYERIQQIEYRDNPIYRLFNVKSATITVEGGSVGMSVIATGQFPVDRYAGVEEHIRKTY